MARTLTRWDPFNELIELRTHLDRVVSEHGNAREGIWPPAVDIVRGDDAVIVRAELPGIKPEDVKVEVEGDVLTVSGQHEESTEEKDGQGRYLRRERRIGAFARSIALPSHVEAKKITAKTHDGVVEVTVPLPKDSGQEKIQITPTAA